MEFINGYISFDGKFFSSPAACLAYEEEVTRLSRIADRSKAVVEFFQGNKPRPFGIPTKLLEHLSSIREEDVARVWNDFLLYLFLDGNELFYKKQGKPPLTSLYERLEILNGPRESDERDLFKLKAETAYKVLAFVLEKEI